MITSMTSGDLVIQGLDVDSQGRCAHWSSDVDVVANLCSVCGWWACRLCHDGAAGHDFGRAGRAEPSVMCGACGAVFSYEEYEPMSACARCGHGFNPGCRSHADLYIRGGDE